MAKSKKKAAKSVSLKRAKGRDKVSTPVTETGKKAGKAVSSAADVPIQLPQDTESNGITGVVGLSNLGNTCFFNSVLQVLVASPPLQQFFSQPDYKVQQAPLSGGLQEVFQQAQSKPASAADAASSEKGKLKKQKLKGTYTPQRLHTAVCKYAPHFKGFQEQDSHELLRVLLEGIQAEESRNFTEPQPRPHPTEEDEPHKVKEGKPAPAPPQGFLSEVFAGQLSSTVTCQTCHHQSTTLEPFMDLSLPIPQDTLAQLESFDRRGKKGRIGKKGAADAEEFNGKLGYKEKKKLAKEEKQAAKLANKGKPKANKGKAAASILSSDTPTSSAESAIKTPSDAVTAQGKPDAAAQPDNCDVTQSTAASTDTSKAFDAASVTSTQLQATTLQAENIQHAQGVPGDSSKSASGTEVCTADDTESGNDTASGKQHAQQANKPVDGALSPERASSATSAEPANGKQPAEPADNESPAEHAEPADSESPAEHAEPADNMDPAEPDKPRDVMQNIEALGKLPDMPKVDYSDDLPGLFQAAFATCDTQLSPRRAAKQQPNSISADELSLYDDADEALEEEDGNGSGGDGVILDASDEESQQKAGPAAEPLLASFVNNSSPAEAQSSQAGVDDDGCGMIGSLFDECAAEGTDHTAEHDPWSDDEATGTASKEATLQACLKQFFSQEEITWECPAEKQSKKKTRRKSLAEAASGTPQSPATPSQAAMNGLTRLSVSFSETEPVVTQIPGSVEQRGKVFRTATGEPPYCRPLRLGGAYVLLAASMDTRRPTCMHISMQPRDEEEATLVLAPNDRRLATADVPAPKVGESEEEVQLAQAQVLMDCIADLLAQKELEGMLAWCEGGLKLKLGTPSSNPGQRTSDSPQHWIVVGQIPEAEGSGKWEYPSSTTDSTVPSPSETPVLNSAQPTNADSSRPASDLRASTGNTDLTDSVVTAPNGAASPPSGSDSRDPSSSGSGDGPHQSQEMQHEVGSQPEAAVSGEQATPATPNTASHGSGPGPMPDEATDQLTSEKGSGPNAQDCSSSKQKQKGGSANGKPLKSSPRTPPKKGGLVNVQRPAVKGYLIHKCPPLLTIHVKRFQQDMRGRLSKLDGNLPFSVSLDLTCFCDPKGPDAAGARYTLLGFVQHMGTMRSGHYEACVQRGLSLADSPAVQTLLRKHGIHFPLDDVALKLGKPGKGNSKATSKPAKEAVAASNRASASGNVQKGKEQQTAETVNTETGTDQPKAESSASDNAHAETNGKAVPESLEASDSSSASVTATNQSSSPTLSGHSHAPAVPAEAKHDTAVRSETQAAAEPASQSSSPDPVADSCPDLLVDTGGNTRTSTARSDKELCSDQLSQSVHRTWYCISDAHVRVISEEDVLSREAYILMYMRVA